MRTLLFDIDGTLLQTNGGGSRAIKLALEREFDLPTACVDIDFSGRTDRSLLIELLNRNALAVDRENQERLRRSYAKLFPRILAEVGGRVLPGIQELLHRLASEADFRCYIMTGNLRETATHKLEYFGLARYFRGVFGGDHDEHRDQLAQRTADALRDRYGQEAAGDVIVVGDTPADIRCGHAIGAKVLAVCTGNFDRHELAAENPLAVHDDLADVTTILQTLISSNGSEPRGSEPRGSGGDGT